MTLTLLSGRRQLATLALGVSAVIACAAAPAANAFPAFNTIARAAAAQTTDTSHADQATTENPVAKEQPAASSAVRIGPFGLPGFIIEGCGTVDEFGIVDLSGEVFFICRVVHLDRGGTYTAAGLENFELGDRVFVRGQACFICLSVCRGATPLIFATTEPCDEG